jgi:hypothetical protein
MITKSQIIPILLDASPSFQAFLNDPMERGNVERIYNLLGDFTLYLLKLDEGNRAIEFPAVARALERFIQDGDQEAKNIAIIGLLENLQNVWANNQVDPEQFASHLLPEGRKWWNELNAFWRGERRYVGEGIEPRIV